MAIMAEEWTPEREALAGQPTEKLMRCDYCGALLQAADIATFEDEYSIVYFCGRCDEALAETVASGAKAAKAVR